MPDKALLYDCETNGTDPTKDFVIECAGLLFSVKHASVIAGFTFVVRAEENQAEHINGIPAALVREHGVSPPEAWQRVEAWMSRADVVVAHNAGFDRSFCPELLQNLRPWICSQDDIDWPKPSATQDLGKIALAHGLGVADAHRAMPDVWLLARLLGRVQELGISCEDLLAKASRPKRRYKAVTGRYDPALNEKLKAHAFRWDPPSKTWWRKLVVEEVPELQAKYPFAIVEWPE